MSCMVRFVQETSGPTGYRAWGIPVCHDGEAGYLGVEESVWLMLARIKTGDRGF